MDQEFRGYEDPEVGGEAFAQEPLPQEELSIDDLLADARAHLDGDVPLHRDDEEFYAPEFGEEDFIPRGEPGYADWNSYGDDTPLPGQEGYDPELLEDYVPEFPEDYDRDEEEDFEEEDPGPLPAKPQRRGKKRIVPLFVKIILYVVLVGVSAVGLGYGIWECAQDVLAFGRSDESLAVVVEEGDTVEDIAQMLKEKGVIKYPWLFKFYCKFTDSEDKMDPGNYVLYYNYDYHALVGGMVKRSPNRVTVRVTIPEGYSTAQIFELMEAKGVCTVEELEQYSAEFEFDYWFLEDVPYGEGNRLEGFLFPDTYDFYEKDDPDRVLDKLLTNFNRKFSDKAKEQLESLNAKLAERWAAAGYDESYIADNQLNIHDLITVASMIERETAGVAESGKIASVIYNRLCKPGDFPYLNIDATVVYALGGIDHPLTYEDLEIDSPYNTYKYPGLPAGPISNPGLNSITAALNPTDTNYYYYALDKETGFHYFSKTASEHEEFLRGQE